MIRPASIWIRRSISDEKYNWHLQSAGTVYCRTSISQINCLRSASVFDSVERCTVRFIFGIVHRSRLLVANPVFSNRLSNSFMSCLSHRVKMLVLYPRYMAAYGYLEMRRVLKSIWEGIYLHCDPTAIPLLFETGDGSPDIR